MAMSEFRTKLLSNRNVCLACKRKRGEVLLYGVMLCKDCLHQPQPPLRSAGGKLPARTQK